MNYCTIKIEYEIECSDIPLDTAPWKDCQYYLNCPTWNPPVAFFCKICGMIWARIIPVRGRTDQKELWIVYHRECRSHGNGSIWLPAWGDQAIYALPEYILRRELTLPNFPDD